MRNKVFDMYVKNDTDYRANPVIGDGVSTHLTKNIHEKLEGFVGDGYRKLPAYIKFGGIQPVDIIDYYKSRVGNNDNVIYKDISRTNISLYKIALIYIHKDGRVEDISFYIYLPYLNKGNEFIHSNVKYALSPVFTDKVISTTPNNSTIFIKLLKDKLHFTIMSPINLVINGHTGVYFIPTITHRTKTAKSKLSLSINNTLYLLSKFGYDDLFSRFYGFVPTIIRLDDELKYKRNEYLVIKPDTKNSINVLDFGFVIKKDMFESLTQSKQRGVMLNIAGIIHIIDNVYGKDNSFKYIINASSWGDTNVWLGILAACISSQNMNEYRAFENAKERISNLDDYLDVTTKESLQKRSPLYKKINDFYDLLILIIEQHNNILLEDNRLNRSLEINYYILYNHITIINNNINSVLKIQKSLPEGEQIPCSRVKNELMIRPRVILLGTGKAIKILPATSISYPGSNRLIGMSIHSEVQESGNGVLKATKESKRNINYPLLKFNPLDILLGNILMLTKRLPIPCLKLNPFLNVDPNTGDFNFTEQQKKRVMQLRNYLTRR